MIYILEFSRPMHHARFYVGFCEDDRLTERLKDHNSGRGAAITRAARQQGIELILVATLEGDRRKERQKNTPRLVRNLSLQQSETNNRDLCRLTSEVTNSAGG